METNSSGNRETDGALERPEEMEFEQEVFIWR